jgi:hypothetical protein
MAHSAYATWKLTNQDFRLPALPYTYLKFFQYWVQAILHTLVSNQYRVLFRNYSFVSANAIGQTVGYALCSSNTED